MMAQTIGIVTATSLLLHRIVAGSCVQAFLLYNIKIKQAG
jgi:hypothetical protein